MAASRVISTCRCQHNGTVSKMCTKTLSPGSSSSGGTEFILDMVNYDIALLLIP